MKWRRRIWFYLFASWVCVGMAWGGMEIRTLLAYCNVIFFNAYMSLHPPIQACLRRLLAFTTALDQIFAKPIDWQRVRGILDPNHVPVKHIEKRIISTGVGGKNRGLIGQESNAMLLVVRWVNYDYLGGCYL